MEFEHENAAWGSRAGSLKQARMLINVAGCSKISLTTDDIRTCRRTSDLPAPARTSLYAAVAQMADTLTFDPGYRKQGATAAARYDPIQGAPDDI
ncbi:hypothetical protein ABIC11_004603 [Pseudomonas oryzihabitans]